MRMGKKVQQVPTAPLRLLISVGDAHQKLSDRIEKGKRILQIEINSWDQLESAKKEYYKWSDYNKELLKQMFTNESMADEYSWIGAVSISPERNLAHEIREFHSDVNGKIHRLESISERLELIPLSDGVKSALDKQGAAISIDNSKVFVVHGHDEAACEMIARFIEHLGLEPIILHEQVSAGKTIIEKLEHYSDVGYTVVLLTPDDEGRKKAEGDILRDRARQNVLLELGYFTGKLGRRRVCALHRGSVEIPTDYLGVLYIPLDDAGGWQLKLARELKAVGFDIDMNKAI
jgi:predicted nucleotide-binding protein